jgi:hypothetical protein
MPGKCSWRSGTFNRSRRVPAQVVLLARNGLARLVRRREPAPSAFQLSYGKYRDEHAIRWKLSQGYTHYRVDDGRSAGIAAGAPLLTVDGAFHAGQVLARFLELSTEVPSPIAEFVAARLREHPAYREGH